MASAALIAPPSYANVKQRNIQLGHTGITWPNTEIDQAIQAVASLGFYGFETFGDVLTKWEEKGGGLGAVLEQNQIPLISAYCTVNLTDPTRRTDELAKAVNWCGLIK